MSRLRKFAHSLLSGYVLLGANIAYTLGSVPLAFEYLSKLEFGLWAMTSQLAGYIALIDFGLSGVSRILIDHKDRKGGGEYGGLIQTTVLVSVAQGFLILLCGMAFALGLAAVLEVPPTMQRQFAALMIGQSALLAGMFTTRVFNYLLGAHQRYDVVNVSQTVSFVGNFIVLWVGFTFDQGVYSMLWGQLTGWLLSTVICLVWCLRLKLFPPEGCWGRLSWRRFREVFVYGRDIFLFMAGAQMVTASQTILITKALGLEAAAIWSVCLRTFTLIQQLIYRIFDFSCAALAEMIVQGEKERLHRRFKSIVVLSCSLSVAAGVLFAVCNQSFVHIWSQGKIGWPAVNDLLLAVWLVICVCVRTHTGLVGQIKDFRALRYIFFLEGLFFIAVSLALLDRGGITAMLAVSISASLLFTFPYGIWRTSELFGISWRSVVFGWSQNSLRLVMFLAPVGLSVWWLTRPCSPAVQLLICGGTIGLAGMVGMLRFGMEPDFQQEAFARSPAWLRAGMILLGGRRRFSNEP